MTTREAGSVILGLRANSTRLQAEMSKESLESMETAGQEIFTAMIQWATEIKVRAERRCGELLRESAADKSRNTGGKPSHRVRVSTLADLGVTEKQSSRYQKLAAMPEEHFETAVATAPAPAVLQLPFTERVGHHGHEQRAAGHQHLGDAGGVGGVDVAIELGRARVPHVLSEGRAERHD